MGVALFDWDGTIASGYSMNRWIDFLEEKKIISPKLNQNLSILVKRYTNGEISYEKVSYEFIEIYGKELAGIDERIFIENIKEFIKYDQQYVYDTARNLLKWCKKNNLMNYVITGSDQRVIEQYKDILEIDKVFGTYAEVKDSFFTGRVLQNTSSGAGKINVLNSIKDEITDCVLAVGDSPSDIPLFDLAKHCIVITGNHDFTHNDTNKNYLYLSSNCTGDIDNFLSNIEV